MVLWGPGGPFRCGLTDPGGGIASNGEIRGLRPDRRSIKHLKSQSFWSTGPIGVAIISFYRSYDVVFDGSMKSWVSTTRPKENITRIKYSASINTVSALKRYNLLETQNLSWALIYKEETVLDPSWILWYSLSIVWCLLTSFTNSSILRPSCLTYMHHSLIITAFVISYRGVFTSYY